MSFYCELSLFDIALDLSLEICASDPSHLSSTQYYYQVALEALLSLAFPLLSGSHSVKELQKFREIYGNSAFTCRYPHCERALDGFTSHQDREKHEARIAVNTDMLPLLVHIPKWALLPELNLMGITVNITP
jgi:hypothetical protein